MVRFSAALVAAMFLLVLCSSGVVQAGTLNVTTLPAQTFDGYYVGPAAGFLDGSPVQWICDDFAHTTYVPSTFDVNVSTLPLLPYARFVGPEELANYEMASMLAYEMYQPGNASQVGAIQFAMWNLFDPSTPDPAGTATWLTWAQNQNRAAWDYSPVRVLTPTAAYASNQEGIVNAATPTPEPGSEVLSLLGGIGLIFAGRFHRRRWQRNNNG